ncbi:MAG: hypothetical protein AAF311_01900 [Pseudomonadota bacterium]
MTRLLSASALALLAAAPASADIFDIAAANRASGTTDTPTTVPYIHTVEATVSGRKGDTVKAPVTARLRIDPSRPEGERVTILSRSDSDAQEMDNALEDLIEQIEENDAEDQADGFWCSARDSDAFPITPDNFTVIADEGGTTRLKPVPDRMVQLMMGEDDLSELGGRERAIAKKLIDRLDGELRLDSADGQMRGMSFEMTRPMSVMLIAKIKQMAVSVECDRAPNGYPFVSRFSMHVEAGAFGQDMVNDMELRVSELTPVEAYAATTGSGG